MAGLDAPSAPKTTLGEDLRALLRCPRELWLVYLATFFEYLGIFSFLPTLPLWLSGDFGMDDQRAGWWAATFSTLVTLFVFLVGSIADTVGVRRTLLIAFALLAHVVVPDANLLSMPPPPSFEEAAAIPLCALTAWQRVVRKGQVHAGQMVLAQAAGGGVSSAEIPTSRGCTARACWRRPAPRRGRSAREITPARSPPRCTVHSRRQARGQRARDRPRTTPPIPCRPTRRTSATATPS